MQTTKTTKTSGKHPSWWKKDFDSTWDRVKAAFKRDWAQTTGEELNQDAGDTLKQAAGKEPIPPKHVANPPDSDAKWEDVEDAFRFGHGARSHYGDRHPEWNDELESELRRDWDTFGSDQKWEARSRHVRRGYDRSGSES